MHQRIIARLSLAVVLALALPVGADQRAKAANGREVILHDDGTWVYADAPAADKSPKAVLQYTGKRGTFGLYLTPGRWRQMEKPISAASEVSFVHKDGDAWAMVIVERITVPLPALRAAAMENFKMAGQDIKILKEERRKVNGNEVLCLQLNATVQGIPATFYNYYFSNETGSYQLVTYTGQSIFKELQPEMEAFLNGFTLLKKQ